jgi:hypothetical protein
MMEKSMDEKITTSWMWRVDDGVNALVIDTDKRLLKWYDEIGCACSDDDLSIEQTISDYLVEGMPVGINVIPEDVQLEIAQSVQKLTT